MLPTEPTIDDGVFLVTREKQKLVKLTKLSQLSLLEGDKGTSVQLEWLMLVVFSLGHV